MVLRKDPDTDAWEQRYLQYADDVCSYLLSMCHDTHLAEDLTSETFLEAHRCFASYNGRCKLSVWLCAIARHLLYRHYETVLKTRYLTDDPAAALLQPDPSAEEVYFREAHLRALYKKINALPGEARAVFCLRVFEDCPYTVIASLLGISEANARVIFYRTKLLLQKEEEA